jgi:hypothetical protein
VDKKRKLVVICNKEGHQKIIKQVFQVAVACGEVQINIIDSS